MGLLDSILEDWASPRVRRLVHALLVLVSFLASLYFASGGDWTAFAAAIIAAVYADANRVNTHEIPIFDDGSGDEEPEDDYDTDGLF